MKTTKTALLFLLISVLTAQIALAAPSASPELRQKAKSWALRATSQALTLNYDDYKRQIKANRAFLTEKGCEAFINALENYDLYDQLRDYRNDLSASLWERKIGMTQLEQIVIDEEYKDKTSGLYKFKMEVPLKIKNSNGKTANLYNFMAIVTVVQTTVPHAPFMIDNWHTVVTNRPAMGIRATNFDPERYKRRHLECKID